MLKCEVIQQFKGTINGVEIGIEPVYNSTEWIFTEVIKHIEPSNELIQIYVDILSELVYMNDEFFDIADFEEELADGFRDYTVEKDLQHLEYYELLEDFIAQLNKEI